MNPNMAKAFWNLMTDSRKDIHPILFWLWVFIFCCLVFALFFMAIFIVYILTSHLFVTFPFVYL